MQVFNGLHFLFHSLPPCSRLQCLVLRQKMLKRGKALERNISSLLWTPLLHLPAMRALLLVVVYYRVIEARNQLGWKRPLRTLSPTINSAQPSPPPAHVPRCHIGLDYLVILQHILIYLHFPSYSSHFLAFPTHAAGLGGISRL